MMVEVKEMKENQKNEFIRVIKFILFSISAGLIQIGTFTLMNELAMLPYWPSYLTSLVLSILWNFTINRKLTFKSANNVSIAMLKVSGFYLVFTPLSTWWGYVLTNNNWHEYIVLGGTMIINFITEFLYLRFFVFGKSIDSAINSDDYS